MRRLLAALALVSSLAVPVRGQDREVHSEHFLHGPPAGAPETNDLVVRDIYALSNNEGRKMADWVAYRIHHRTVEGPAIRRRWRPDPWLDADERLERDDYAGAYAELDVDRGHQAPLAAFRGTLKADQTNYLSNVTPQRSALNQGPWRALEEAVRDVARRDTVHVVTGPLYEREMPGLPGADEPHAVPSGYWKIVALDTSDGVESVAVVMDQETVRGSDYCGHRVSVAEVEERSGLDVFPRLDDGGGGGEAVEASEELAGRLDC